MPGAEHPNIVVFLRNYALCLRAMDRCHTSQTLAWMLHSPESEIRDNQREVFQCRAHLMWLLNATAVCAIEGFWLPLTVEIASLTEAQGRDARNRLVSASLLRSLIDS